jgi:hypothetical protein
MMRKVEHGFGVSFTLVGDEATRLKTFLEQTGRKAGPWAKTLVTRALDEDASIQAGRTQIDAAALRDMVRR